MKSSHGSTLHCTQSGARRQSHSGIPCFEMGNDSAWQCWWNGQACSSVLPDKIACFLYEYHYTYYTSLGLPALPMDRSDISVHSNLRPDQVLNICKIRITCRICKIWHIVYTVHIYTLYVQQNRALLDTLRIHASNNNRGHIVLYSRPGSEVQFFQWISYNSHTKLVFKLCLKND